MDHGKHCPQAQPILKLVTGLKAWSKPSKDLLKEYELGNKEEYSHELWEQSSACNDVDRHQVSLDGQL